MSKYTITIKDLLRNNFDFGLKDYPIFNNDYREKLNTKILNHYFMNEIGFETAELFKFYLNNKMEEIMPYYNNLYNKQNTLLNNLENNISITEVFSGENNSTTESNSTSQSTNSGTSNNKNVFQDTPQNQIMMTNIENQKWATNFTQDERTSNNVIADTSSVSGEGTNENNYTKTINGSNGKYNIEILKEIKNNLLNIDLMIINELEDLFMGIY